MSRCLAAIVSAVTRRRVLAALRPLRAEPLADLPFALLGFADVRRVFLLRLNVDNSGPPLPTGHPFRIEWSGRVRAGVGLGRL